MGKCKGERRGRKKGKIRQARGIRGGIWQF